MHQAQLAYTGHRGHWAVVVLRKGLPPVLHRGLRWALHIGPAWVRVRFDRGRKAQRYDRQRMPPVVGRLPRNRHKTFCPWRFASCIVCKIQLRLEVEGWDKLTPERAAADMKAKEAYGVQVGAKGRKAPAEGANDTKVREASHGTKAPAVCDRKGRKASSLAVPWTGAPWRRPMARRINCM